MTTHPLLLSTPMVLAFLAGRKTVTRRIPGPTNSLVDGRRVSGKTWKALNFAKTYGIKDNAFYFFSQTDEQHHRVEPIYQPGDKLWFRETWAPYLRGTDNNGFTRLIKFKADDAEIELPDELIDWFEKVQENGFKWRPSIHMPKEACRLWADCGAVTCEHLDDITEEQAISEGIEKLDDGLCPWKHYHNPDSACFDAKTSFMTLWESIHGLQSWYLNPPVYAINFNPTTRKP